MVLEKYKPGLEIEFKKGHFNDYKDSILSILESNNLLSLATLGLECTPHLCSVYYVYDDEFNLYFWSDVRSAHSKNIKKNGLAAVNIANTGQEWGTNLQGLQVRGRVNALPALKMIKPAKLYLKRFSLVKKLIKSPLEFNTKFNSKLYKIEIDWIKLLDEAKFGKEVWTEFEIKRK